MNTLKTRLCSLCRQPGHTKVKCLTSSSSPTRSPSVSPKIKTIKISPKKYIIKCPSSVIEGRLITKEKRQEIYGNVAGGSGSMGPENQQRRFIEEGTGVKCLKTNYRINLENHKLVEIAHPNKQDDGFEYTENFDGIQSYEEKKVYINLKCVVGNGGAQTRSLREVYWLTKGQLEYLLKNNESDLFFANILDGDESYKCMRKYNYLLSKPQYKDIKDKVYTGDLKNYFEWIKNILN